MGYILSVVIKALLNIFFQGQHRVEIAARSPSDMTVKHRIDVIGTNLKGLNPASTLTQKREQRQCDSRFANTASLSGND
jgi:hypothetical protein